MLSCGADYPVEKYADYRNRTKTKNKEKLENMLSGIKSNSLHESDKKNLLQEMVTILHLELIKYK